MNKRQIIIALLCLIISVTMMVSWNPIQYAGYDKQDVMDEQTAYKYMNSYQSDFIDVTPVMNNLNNRYEFTIQGRKFIVNLTNVGIFSMEYANGSVRTVYPANFTYVDKVNEKETRYSIASVPNGNRASLDYLYANLTYIAMFRDYDVIDKLKSYGSAELNIIVSYIINNPYTPKTQITKPSKKVTNLLYFIPYIGASSLYTVKEGQPLDVNAGKIINTSEYDHRGEPRKDLKIIRDSIRQRKYNCNSEKDTKQFLEDLSYVPTLQGCPYQSVGKRFAE